MPTRSVENDIQRAALHRYIDSMPLPMTVTVQKGKRRTTEQNRLQRQWCSDIACQLADRTAENVRGYCKLHFGVPILRAENEAFCVKYDETFKPLPYETKIALMQEPFDFPVTRILTTKQKTVYLDAMHAEFAGEMGLILTDPDALKNGWAA